MAILNGYATLVQVKAALRITDSTDDALLEQAIESASRRIDGYCGRFFYQTIATVVQIRATEFSTQLVKDISDTTVIVKSQNDGTGTFATTWLQGTDYMLEPLDASIVGVPYTAITAIGGKVFTASVPNAPPTLQVSALWGWAAVPSDVREACVLLSMRQFARLNAALGVVGFADMAVTVRAVDPDVRDLLNPYRLIGLA